MAMTSATQLDDATFGKAGDDLRLSAEAQGHVTENISVVQAKRG
jgi:hypothetical protein